MSREKLRRVVALLQIEAQHPSSRAREAVARLRELAALYEQECAPPDRDTDRALRRALERMHARLDAPWTVAALAREAGMSRATFARRFAAAFGAPPLRYLHEQRMERAAARLLESDAGLAGVAREVGYESEWAFGRAFKRHHGVAPGVFRRTAAVRAVPSVTRPTMAAFARAA